MADPFLYSRPQVADPARSAATVTPHDSNEITPTKALYVGTGGTVVVRLLDDSANVTLTNVANGQVLPIRAKLVVSTGTTASGIVALY